MYVCFRAHNNFLENPEAKIGLALFQLAEMRIYDEELFEEVCEHNLYAP